MDDEALARELARHYQDDGEAPTLDQALARLAEACWKAAPRMAAAGFDESAARASKIVMAALDVRVDGHLQHSRARSIVKEFLRRGGHLVRRMDPFTTRLHWTIWLMAQRLFETSVQTDAERCADRCEMPERCPAAQPVKERKPQTSTKLAMTAGPCLQSFVFPFLHHAGWNTHKAARAIVRGIRQANVVRTRNGDPYIPSEAAVRQVIKRFSSTH